MVIIMNNIIIIMIEMVGGWFQGVTPKEQLYQPFNLEEFLCFLYILCVFQGTCSFPSLRKCVYALKTIFFEWIFGYIEFVTCIEGPSIMKDSYI